MGTTITSPAAQVIISIIPIVGIVIGGVVVFFYLLWRHREKSLQIRTGVTPRRLNLRVFSFLIGVLLVCVGAVLTVVFLLLAGRSYTLLGGLIPLSLGIGCLIFYKNYPESPADVRQEG
ncbi:MAG: hypothetical protein LBR23_09160 [Spirochaetaceae bacterium]|jgi:quinol-cytochrome oxidoreductase complex cytochrome b subunit|nr:hypothetical protein [Spirochaetaceae bacterium]